MNYEAIEKVLGTGLLHEGEFGALIKQHFPEATALDLYGAAAIFTADGEIVEISCMGRRVRIKE